MPDDINFVLKEAVQLTNVCWAAILEHDGGNWRLQASYRLDKRKQVVLLEYLQEINTNVWLSGCLSAGRTRTRKIGAGLALDCSHLYAFPASSGHGVTLVGSNDLSKDTRRIWHLLSLKALDDSANGLVLSSDQVNLLVPDQGTDNLLSTSSSLERVLAAFVRNAGALGGWLAVRSGEQLEVRAESGNQNLTQKMFPIQGNTLYARIQQTLSVLATHTKRSDWSDVPVNAIDPRAQAWVGIPLTVGQRMIGQVTLWREQPFLSREWQNLTLLAAHVAPVVELNITFDDIASHLRRLALLNDFARTVSSATDLDEIAQRVFALLRRTFNTDWISLFLLSPDSDQLRSYSPGISLVQNYPTRRNPLVRMMRSGGVMRLDNITTQSTYAAINDEAVSALLAPLKYRGQVIGALSLEGRQVDAFSVYDENLLQVIASHLAGLVEYGRLREDAEARARNLGLIHEVVQQVIGLTDVFEVAQIAADLLTKYFAYELAAVLLVDEHGEVTIRGIGGSSKDIVQASLESSNYSAESGITGHVLRTGTSMLVSDVSQSEYYLAVNGWGACSEMCVPLKVDDNTIGVINIESTHINAFSQNDLLVLEALAGILSGVIVSAEQYQRLQMTRDELQARIEAQREAERRFIQAAKLAAVGEMAAGVAHELNNPLTTVSGFAELVHADLPPDAPQKGDLELIMREAARARSVVRRLLDFSRQSEMVRTRTDLNEIVTDILSLTSHLLRTSGVEVHTQLLDRLPWPSVDRNQVKQVLLNLLHNAMHAMPDGGILNVMTETRSRNGRQWLAVSIRDTGVGISSENMERIFEPFFTTRSDEGGTGLGLSVSYGIVADHGGFIDVESQLNVGTCFTVWLPVESE